VVRSAGKITVTLNDKRTFPGKMVGVDRYSDLALVKIEADNLPTLALGNSSGLRPGEYVVAIGNPLGYDHTVTHGSFPAGRTIRDPDNQDINPNMNFIQTDAAINPGNSGGPLLNLKERRWCQHSHPAGLRGQRMEGPVVQNIGFAIPADVARSVSADLLAHGKISRPWLGMQMQDLDDNLRKSLGLEPGSKACWWLALLVAVPPRRPV